MTAPQLAVAYTLDLLLGDPEWFPHPVRLFGLLTQMGESLLRPIAVGPKGELLAGAALTTSIAAFAWIIGRPRNFIWQVMLGWTVLATRSLLKEAGAVIAAMEAGDIDLARQRLARIVGRDTAPLDDAEILRAVIETLAESTCDGIVAPLFWLAAGGVPAAMAYKAINTLDSMIGHLDPTYKYFGRAAARWDDAANFIPARMSALGIVAAAYLMNLEAGRAWRIWKRDGNMHASPNAGQSEAAMAGALNVRLGGVNVYQGRHHYAPAINLEGSPASTQQARSALSVVAVASGLAFATAMLVVGLRQRR